MMRTSPGESGGDDNGTGSDGRKTGKRELSTSKRAAQNISPLFPAHVVPLVLERMLRDQETVPVHSNQIILMDSVLSFE